MKKLFVVVSVFALFLSSGAASADCGSKGGDVIANVDGEYLIHPLALIEAEDGTCGLVNVAVGGGYCFAVAQQWVIDWYEDNYMLPEEGQYIVRTFTADQPGLLWGLPIQTRIEQDSLDETSLRRINGGENNYNWYGWEGYSEPAPLGPNGEIDHIEDFDSMIKSNVWNWGWNWSLQSEGQIYIDTHASKTCLR